MLLRLLRLLLPFAPVRRLLLPSDSRSFFALGSFVHDLTLWVVLILVQQDQIEDDEANGWSVRCMICVGWVERWVVDLDLVLIGNFGINNN